MNVEERLPTIKAHLLVETHDGVVVDQVVDGFRIDGGCLDWMIRVDPSDKRTRVTRSQPLTTIVRIELTQVPRA